MKKLAFAAALAALASAPGAAFALPVTTGAWYGAYSKTSISIYVDYRIGTFTAEPLVRETKDEVVTIGSAVIGTDTGGETLVPTSSLPATSLRSLALEAKAIATGEATSPFGYVGGSSGVAMPGGPGDFDVEAVFEVKITNELTTDYLDLNISLSADAGAGVDFLDLPGRAEAARGIGSGFVSVTDSNGTELASSSAEAFTDALLGPTGPISENGSFSFNPRVPAGDYITVSLFSGAHGFAQLSAAPQISAVPVPAALPLLAGAVGLLGFMGARRRRRDDA